MRVAHEQFAGVVPRVAPHRLGPANAQAAVNARLQSGDLEAWRQFASVQRLATAAPVRSIYLLNDAWLSWGSDVDAARGPVPGDQTFRLYLTGPDVYSTPRFTNYSMATNSGAVAFPTLTRPLGVPAPIDAPVVVTTSPVADPTSFTAYVYTYVNDLDQESAPSPPSNTVQTPVGTLFGNVNEITITSIASGVSSDYGINRVRFYRAATGATGTAYRFVEEIAFTGAGGHVADDSGADTQLGEVLPSEDWDLPPDDLRGILALPNGIMAGFVDNQLCLSAQDFPHAWPVGNRYATDTDVVGIGNIDTTVVIFTKSFLYVASGTDPAQYGMAKFEVPYAGVSKRSIAYVDGVGVVGATADGLRAVAGVGQSTNVLRSVFTRRQWQALNPSSILGAAHDGVYFMFYDTGTSDGKGGYAIDSSPSGFGVAELAFHASAVFSDPETDALFLVLDATDEPHSVSLPLASTMPAVDGVTIFEFDSPHGSGGLVYRYRTRLNLIALPLAPLAAQLRAGDFTNLVWRIYGDGALVFESAITAGSEFTLPAFTDTYTTLEFEILGTSRVRDVQVAEDMDELK